MENNDSFRMTYSAQQQEEIQSIRQKYVPKEESKIERLRALDARVTQKATMVSILVGVVGAMIMGCGMSLIMTDFGAALGRAAFPVGIVVGSVGLVITALAYPVYNHTLKKQREMAAPEIIRLTDELMQ